MIREQTLHTLDPRERRPWWKGAVIYQVYPRSFQDSNGDGVGDLAGVTARLDHLASLGVDGVWLSPFFRSPMCDFGYDISDYCDVDPIFGALEDFDRLVARAHRLGLKVIIDQVYCHTSDQHDWFRESRTDTTNPRANWYVWADARPDGAPPSNWQSVFGGPAWTWDARRGQYYLHNFLSSQPALNLHNPDVQDALLQTARFWLDRGVDGFRLDAINFAMHEPGLTDNPPVLTPGKRTRPFDFQHHYFNQSHADIPKFLHRIRTLLDSYGDDRFTVAEVGGELADVEMKTFTHGDGLLNSAYGFNFLYAEHLSPEVIADTFRVWAGTADEGWPSWAFSNHDAPRAVSRWGRPEHRSALARLNLLLLTALRGNMFLYQGEELGLSQAEVPFERLRDPEAIANWPQTLGRDGARTPMPWTAAGPYAGFSDHEPWLPVDPSHRPLAVSEQDADPQSTLNLARQAIALRKAHPALRIGDVTDVACAGSVVSFRRTAAGQTVLCVFNLSDREQTFCPPAGVTLLAQSGAAELATGRLGPYAAVIAQVPFAD